MVTRKIPLVRASMLRPFIRAIKSEGGDAASLLNANDLDPAALKRTDIFVPVITWYRFVEDAAELLNNPYFGYQVGSETALENLPNMRSVDSRSLPSLSESIARLIADARYYSNLGEWTLTTGAEWASFKLRRTFTPNFAPAQIDAFGYGFLTQLIMATVEDKWDIANYSASVSDTHAIPPKVARNLSRSTYDRVSYLFPAEWLYHGTNALRILPEIREPSETPIETFRQALQLAERGNDLTIERVANLCGQSVRSLQRMLSSYGTSFRHEQNLSRIDKAKRLLSCTDMTVAKIADLLGYGETAAFSRAFKKQVGSSPQKYRDTRG